MRLNLGCASDIRTGFINIDKLPCPTAPQEVFKQGDIGNLDWVAEDETVEEIVALDCLQYIPYKKLKETLANWSKKLRPSGKLSILIDDAHLVAKSFASGQINLDEFWDLIYGSKVPNDDRVSCLDALNLCDYLKGLGLTIDTKRYDGVMIYVEAIK